MTVMSSAGTNNDGVAVEWFAEVIDECEEGRFIVVAWLALIEWKHPVWSSSFYLGPLHNVTKGGITWKDKWKALPRVGVNFNGGVVRYELLLLIFVRECSANVMLHFSVTVAGRGQTYLRWGGRGRSRTARGGVIVMCVWMGAAGVLWLLYGLSLCTYEMSSRNFCKWWEVPWL